MKYLIWLNIMVCAFLCFYAVYDISVAAYNYKTNQYTFSPDQIQMMKSLQE